ncbi:SDR family oxidoreductase [Sunxiuqinia elliptica]|uniref:NAD(P)H dehydrogenase (Quinone) n=1 Tax=Sunxiuqinia elliptica TaxID=655355 RepID=A0A4R6H1A6_9BACT|nr:SDR family oxidoreductase [Sunxiuqinia elliptica]TDO01448.1 NAD(P)H dehydrogenase (quinone) [Sunxiuqinia elliptica]TDO57959.1 NAD(P)H dehydrogenase (quinone) [Sunxiuqinia elliptica]
MKIGVTGANGQLGRLIVTKLKERTAADNIIALVRSPQKATDLGVEVRTFDYDNPEVLSKTLVGIDKLMLVSGSEIGKRITQHTNVIEAVKSAGVKFIAYTSLLKADTSTLGLAGEHCATEEMLKESSIPFVLLRNGWYTENYTTSLPDIVAMGTLYGSSGDGKISSVTREDLAEAAAIVLTTDGQEGKVYELAADEAFTMSDLAAEVSRQTEKDIPYVNLPVEEYAQALANSGMPEGLAQFLAGTHVSTEKGDLFDDRHQLSKLLGRPTTTLSKVISDTLSQMK